MPAPYGTVFFSFLVLVVSVFLPADVSTLSYALLLCVGLAPSTGYLVVISTLSFLSPGVVSLVVNDTRSLLLGEDGLFYSICYYFAFLSAFYFSFSSYSFCLSSEVSNILEIPEKSRKYLIGLGSIGMTPAKNAKKISFAAKSIL